MSGRFSGYQASPSHVGSTSFPTPSSRFAVRYVHGFCLMLPSDIRISRNALALLASSFRPVTADHSVPGYAWNGGLCVMPGTRKKSPPWKGGFFTTEYNFPNTHFLAGNGFVEPYFLVRTRSVKRTRMTFGDQRALHYGIRRVFVVVVPSGLWLFHHHVQCLSAVIKTGRRGCLG